MCQSPGGNPRGDALIKTCQFCEHDHGGKTADRKNRSQDDLSYRLFSQGAEKLWPAFKTDRVYEERKENGFDPIVDLNSHLAYHDRYKKGARDASELKPAELDLSDPIAKSQG